MMVRVRLLALEVAVEGFCEPTEWEDGDGFMLERTGERLSAAEARAGPMRLFQARHWRVAPLQRHVAHLRVREAMPAWPEYGARVPLWDAVYRQDTNAVQKMLMSMAGPGQMWMQTSTHLAVDKGNPKILKALLFAGADPNARTINGTTPLHLAVQKKRKDIVQDLLLVGANPLLRNFTNKTAIEMARELEFHDVLPSMLQAATSIPVQRELKRQQEEHEKRAAIPKTTLRP